MKNPADDVVSREAAEIATFKRRPCPQTSRYMATGQKPTSEKTNSDRIGITPDVTSAQHSSAPDREKEPTATGACSFAPTRTGPATAGRSPAPRRRGASSRDRRGGRGR